MQLILFAKFFKVKLKSKTIYKFAETDIIKHYINAR